MTTSAVSVSADSQVSASSSSSSSASQPAGGTFASLLANADSDQESAANVRARANKTNTAEALALAGQVPVPLTLQVDSRGWNLSLAKEQKAEAATRDTGGTKDTTADDVPEKARPASVLHQGEVAFAVNFMKSPATNVPAPHGPSSAQSATAVPSAATAQSSQGKSGNKEQHGNPDTPGDPAAPAIVHTGATPQSTPPAALQTPASNPVTMPHAVSSYTSLQSPAKAASVPSTTAATDIAEPAHTQAARPQSLDFRVAGADDREVNVRVSQRSGDVQVTVRTGDVDLAQSLRQHLPELSDRLAQTGVQSDIWRPSAAAGSGADSSTGSEHQDDAQAYGSGAGENAAGQHQENDQQQKAWLNELFSAEKGE